jgi:hypothetical protein
MRSLRLCAFAFCALAFTGCGGSSSSSSSTPPQAQAVRVRFVEGAPELMTLINGVPTDIGLAYLQVDGSTVATSFPYGAVTPFVLLNAGTHSLKALDELGYFVGPVKTNALSPGGRYTIVLVGAYPNYRALTFAEPASSKNAQLSLYEASPTDRQSGFGSFRANSSSDFKQLGSATYGSVSTVSLGSHVSDFGGYAGSANDPFGALTLAQVNAFDAHNELPFHAAARLSLFLFDPKSGSASRVFGSLDQ